MLSTPRAPVQDSPNPHSESAEAEGREAEPSRPTSTVETQTHASIDLEVPGDPDGPPEGDLPVEGDAPSAFPAGMVLFIEIVEERVMKSESGGQTTSLAGDQPSYEYAAAAGTLVGSLKGPQSGGALTIVGRLVRSQIDRSTAEVGQLYSLTSPGQAFGLVTVDRVASDGSVVVLVGGDMHMLRPGESVSLVSGSREDADRLAVSAASHTITVTNHGFLARGDLTIGQP
jgi:hypothetical protein